MRRSPAPALATAWLLASGPAFSRAPAEPDASGPAAGAERPAAAGDALPGRLFFEGGYSYQGHRGKVSCTLRPTDGSGYDVYWTVPWQRTTLEYEGTMELDRSAGKVSGTGKSLQFPYEFYRVSGTLAGGGAGLTMTMHYSGVHDGPITLEAAGPPAEQEVVAGTIEAVDPRKGRLTVAVRTRDSKPVEQADRDRAYEKRDGKRTKIGADPGIASVSIDPGSVVKAGTRRMAAAHLRAGQPIQVLGLKADEGLIARIVIVQAPEVFVGSIEAIDADAGTLAVSVRRRKDRKAPEARHTVRVDGDVLVKVGRRQGTLADLRAGQGVTLLAVEWEGTAPLSVIAVEASPSGPARGAPSTRAAAAKDDGPAGLDPDDRAALASWAAEAKARAISRIARAVEKGARPHVYVEMGGQARRGRVTAASDTHLSVALAGVVLRTTWEKLPPRRFVDLAIHVVGDDATDALLDVAAVAARAGEEDSLEQILAAVRATEVGEGERFSLVERAAAALRAR